MNWETELMTGGERGERLGKVKLKHRIFQGDCLSPLLFVLSLTPMSLVLHNVKTGYDLRSPRITDLSYMDDLKLFGKTEKQLDSLMNMVHIYGVDTSIEFSLSKCGVLIVQKGKLVNIVGIEFPSGEKTKETDLDSGYKYLGVLEADCTKDTEM